MCDTFKTRSTENVRHNISGTENVRQDVVPGSENVRHDVPGTENVRHRQVVPGT